MISPRTITQRCWAGSLPEVKSPLSQALNATARSKTRALERCQQLCWDYWFCEAAGIQNEQENQIPTSTEKEHFAFLLRKAPACCLTVPRGPVRVPSAVHFLPPSPGKRVAHPPLILTLRIRPHEHFVCLHISKGWCFLSPSASKFFNISDLCTLLYTSETWPRITVQSFY